MNDPPMTDARSWWVDEPQRLAREKTAMSEVAPQLAWRDDEPSGGWAGSVPLWPFDRPEPAGVAALTGGQPLTVSIVYGHAFPMVVPIVYPVSVEPDVYHRTDQAWHVAGDGRLCLLQEASHWDPDATAADLVPKMSGWYIEYLLMVRKRIDRMTIEGLAASTDLDELLRIYPVAPDGPNDRSQ
jgi:hypothetical protein